ncbi:MAG: phosphate acyltransferase PlsX, partial [Deltaproteobacteria bacterium]|nr:phosphate acyltransferase PlsX [Deltaproteobacteria bacterium]
IAVDAMGGDNGPSVIIEGAIEAAKKGIEIILVGDEKIIEKELNSHKVKNLPITIKNATEVVEMNESPAQAIRKKKDSSIRVCFDLVKEGKANAVVSAGNSGAAMAAGMFLLKRLPGVERPAIAVTVPTMKTPAVLLDMGGNVDCKPIHLAQFAIMGSVYASCVLKKENPTIGLLSNASEIGKGNELTRLTHELLLNTSLNYVGYKEGKDIYKGETDVIVSDGFVGNVVLKVSEGLVEAVIQMLKEEIKASFLAKIGVLLAKGAFKKLKKKIDYSEYGGAPLLGINGSCMISHGASNSKAIMNAIIRATEYVEGDVDLHMTEEFLKNSDLAQLATKQLA